MYHYLDDKAFLHRMRARSGEIMQNLCHNLKEDHDIGANFYLVGSGARNLIMQNENLPVDLDYNLDIIRCENINKCRDIKECVRKAFNKALNAYGLHDCEDSTSCLTSKGIWFKEGNTTEFSIDLCIVFNDASGYTYRLIHEKSGFFVQDRYYWNKAPQSKDLRKKVDYIKKHGKWARVREQYLTIKNRYLSQNDTTHPSFICYTEAINNVYNTRMHW